MQYFKRLDRGLKFIDVTTNTVIDFWLFYSKKYKNIWWSPNLDRYLHMVTFSWKIILRWAVFLCFLRRQWVSPPRPHWPTVAGGSAPKPPD